MTTTLKAIETHYKGYRFRSRLEARWAVFFDALKIKWEYEPEGFQFSDGTRYLPDFWLPTFCGGMWAEVKPDTGDWGKARQLCIESQQMVWQCEGVPAVRSWWVFKLEDGEIVEYEGIPNADQATEEDRMFWEPGYQPDEEPDCVGDFFITAVNAARGARFEHGEKGAAPRPSPVPQSSGRFPGLTFHEGDIVTCEPFGKGQVANSVIVNGFEQCTVVFSGGSVKRLAVPYARLQRIGHVMPS